MPARRRVWVALANRVLREALIEQLNDTPGLQAVDGGSGASGVPDSPPPDAALVDVSRQGEFDGAAFPVLGIGRGPAGDCHAMNELPLRAGDLVARIQAAILESRDRLGCYRIGTVEFDLGQACIRKGEGGAFGLTAMECEMLLHLCRSGARSVPRNELLNAVWGYSSLVETHTVETHIWRLRSILGEAGCGDVLRTGEGGYRLEPPAVRVHDSGKDREGAG